MAHVEHCRGGGRVPLVVITGFLGAGKTTFLRELLPLVEARGLEPYVIINDYANARVDAATLSKEGRKVAPLTGNCICCDSILELMTALLDIPAGERTVVLVEANGTSDPASLIEHLLVNPQLREKFSPLMQVAVVDPQRWQKRRGHNELERLQVETASHLLVTREESTPRERFEDVLRQLREINHRAASTNRFGFAMELEAVWKGDAGPVCSAGGECDCVEPHDHDECCGDVSLREGDAGKDDSCHHGSSAGHVHEHGHARGHRHGLSHAFVGMEVDLPDPMPAAALQEWLKSLPEEVLRVKGLVRLAEEPDAWFQFHRVDAALGEAALVPLSFEPSVPACAVLIGVRLDEEAIRKALRQVCAAGTQRVR